MDFQNSFDNIDDSVKVDFFHNTFRVGAAATKTFVLLLANRSPRSLLSGKNIDLDKVLQRYNRSEFHHIYPRAFLRDTGVPEQQINVLGNFCFLSAAENKNIGRKHPSVYLEDLVSHDKQEREATLASAFCSAKEFDDNYEVFLNERCARLVAYAKELTA
ncbi:hypothetical protein ACW9H6_28845 [Pseudomonas sp. SDO528_S397]